MDTALKNRPTSVTSTAAADRAATVAELNRVTLLSALGAVGAAVVALFIIGLVTSSAAFMAAAGIFMVGAAIVGVYSFVNIELDLTR